MPCSTNPVTDFPTFLGSRNSYNLAHSLMTGHSWEAVAEASVLNSKVGVANATGKNFSKNLSGQVSTRSLDAFEVEVYQTILWFLEWSLFELKWPSLLVEHRNFVLFW